MNEAVFLCHKWLGKRSCGCKLIPLLQVRVQQYCIKAVLDYEVAFLNIVFVESKSADTIAEVIRGFQLIAEEA